MNYRLLTATLIASLLLSGCGLFTRTKQTEDAQASISKAQTNRQSQGDGNQGIQKITFVTGISSVTVEKLAQKNQCVSLKGAGQITPKGPVEVYRVACEDGRNFMARCELRQCQPMLAK